MRVGSPGTVYLVLATLEITDAPDVGLQIRPMTAAVARIAPAADSDQIARQQSTPVIFGHQVHHSKPAGLAAGARQRPTTVDIQNIRDCNWREMIVSHLALVVYGDYLAHSQSIIVIAETEELVHPFTPAVGKLSALRSAAGYHQDRKRAE